MSWLHENVSGWQFDWTYPELDEPNRFIDVMSYIKEVNAHYKKGGGTFYFDNEEDRLLFCLKWLSNKEETIFWHPV
jgi:hypothetical protein